MADIRWRLKSSDGGVTLLQAARRDLRKERAMPFGEALPPLVLRPLA